MGLASKLLGYPRLLFAGKPSKLDLSFLATGTVCAIASGVPFPLIAIVFGQLLNDFNSVSCDEDAGGSSQSADSYQGGINNKILLIFYLAIAQFVLIYAHLFCWTMFGSRLAQRLRESYLQNLLRQEPAYFDKLTTGEVASRLSSDVQTIRSGTSEKVGICLSSFSFFITAYIVAFIKDWELAAMLLSLVPAYLAMSLVGSHYVEKYSAIMSDHAATAASVASEAISNMMIVQAFGASARLEREFSRALKLSEIEGLKKAAAVGIQSGLLYFIAYGANGLAFWQGSRQIADSVSNHSGNATVGATFVVIFVLVDATLLLSQVAPFLQLFGAAVGSFQKLHDDISRHSMIDGTNATKGSRVKHAQGAFEFNHVTFRYPSRPEITVLDDVSISVPASKHTAIVGLSGSGKSTIAGIVTRLYDVEHGMICFDGQDIRQINARDLRSFVSLVQQEPSLLNRSILESIAHGLVNSHHASHAELQEVLLTSALGDVAKQIREGKDLEAAAANHGQAVQQIVQLVQDAAKLADAHEFIEALLHGYGTDVGSSGRLISGGQKQRIALARALVKDPAVLILDEATAALDSKSEQRIQQAMNKITSTGSRTVLTIAHRLSTIVNADNIIVMRKGQVIEQGIHSELLAKDGAYAELVKMQNLGSSSSNDGERSSTTSPDTLSKSDKVALSEVEVEKGSLDREPSGDQDTDNNSAAIGGDEEQEEPKTPPKSLWQLLKGYAPAARPHILTIFVALLASSIVGGAFSGEAVIFGNTVGSLNTCKAPSSIRSHGEFFGLMFFVLAIIEFFANIFSWTGFGWVSEKIVYSVRVLSFRSLVEQDLEWHQSEGRTPAMLLSYITRDGAALAGLSGSVIGTLFSITVNLVAAIVLTHIIAWKIALVCLSLVPLLLGAGLMELHILGKFEERHETAYTKSVDIATEAITSIKTVASLSLEDETLNTYRRSLDGPRKETFKVTVQASFFQALTYFFGNCVNALAYWWGSKQIIAGTYTQTQFLIVVFSLLVSALLWSQMFALAPELSSARAAMARILGLIEIGSQKMTGHLHGPGGESADAEAGHEYTKEKSILPSANGPPTGSVEFRDVHFAYPARPEASVLNGLSLQVPPGSFCALVGPSGAGKSTIISLIERFYKPQAGCIMLDGFDITKSQDASFRDSIALVPQESVLFEGTVEFNIGLGAAPGHNASLDEVHEACKLANIHDVIMELPDRYQTRCGPNGNQFSGGQKQRLSIARALVRKPRLLILDEPTSALDAASERLLQDGLEKAAQGITVIVIAHRLRTIMKAGCIFLIESGRCVDQGSHAELMERSQSYRENVMHQTIAE